MKKRARKLPQRERCSDCAGAGELRHGFSHKRWMACQSCGGSGRRSDQVYAKLAGALPNESHFYDEP